MKRYPLGLQAQENPHAFQLRLERLLERSITCGSRFDVTRIHPKQGVLNRYVGPPDHAVAPEHWQGIVTEFALRQRSVGLNR